MSAQALRIAIVGPGRSLHTKRWARRLAERGHETHIYTEHPEPVEGVQVHDILGGRIPGGLGVRRLWRRRHLRREMERLAPDALHSHFLWPYGDWAMRTGARPLLHQAWGSDVLVIPDRTRDGRERTAALLAAADAITVNSDALGRAVAGFGVPDERIHTIGWGVDTVRYSGERDRSLVDEIFPGRPVVASPRLHKELYNLDVLMEAVPLVHRSVPDAAFLFMAYGALTDRLREQAAALGVSESVHFRRFGEEEVPLVFAGSELSVSIPSSDTGRPTSLLEAMASRLPIVLADLPAIRELVDDEDGALIVPQRDPVAVAAAVVRLLTDDELRTRFGDRNRAVVCDRADAARETDRCIELYRQLSRR